MTKIGVGLVLDLSQRGTRGAPGTPFEGGQLGRQDAYLFPDSTDRGTCLVTLGLENFTLPNYSAERLHSTLKDAVGPCAWYARFGMPGARVRRWLGARHYDLALSSSWDVDQSRFWLSSWLRPANGRGWYWPAVYQFLPRTIACLGSRPEACRQSVLEQDDAQAAAPGRLLIPDPPWDARRVRLVGGDHYLADVLRSAGDDRFLEFWNTTLPIDSALSLAVKAPIGAWTVSWQRQRIPTAPLTPVLRLHELLPALGAIGVSLLLVLAVVRRREVR